MCDCHTSSSNCESSLNGDYCSLWSLHIQFNQFQWDVFITQVFISTQTYFQVIPEFSTKVFAKPRWVVELTARAVLWAVLPIPHWVIQVENTMLSPIIGCTRLAKIFTFYEWWYYTCSWDIGACTGTRVYGICSRSTFGVRYCKAPYMGPRIANRDGDTIQEVIIQCSSVVIIILPESIGGAILVGDHSTTHSTVG